MEIVLNFDRKELVIKQTANIKELYKRLKALLGKDLEEWTVASDGAVWYYPLQPTYPWPAYDNSGQIGFWRESAPTTNIYCLSDQVETSVEFKIENKDLTHVLDRMKIDSS